MEIWAVEFAFIDLGSTLSKLDYGLALSASFKFIDVTAKESSSASRSSSAIPSSGILAIVTLAIVLPLELLDPLGKWADLAD